MRANYREQAEAGCPVAGFAAPSLLARKKGRILVMQPFPRK
jgi:hypothetical protein